MSVHDFNSCILENAGCPQRLKTPTNQTGVLTSSQCQLRLTFYLFVSDVSHYLTFFPLSGKTQCVTTGVQTCEKIIVKKNKTRQKTLIEKVL